MYVLEATVWFYLNYYTGVADALQCYVCGGSECKDPFASGNGVGQKGNCKACTKAKSGSSEETYL